MSKIITTDELVSIISQTYPAALKGKIVYGIPRGGWAVAQIIDHLNFGIQTDNPAAAQVIVDDLIDSGATRDKWAGLYPDAAFWTPFEKPAEWLVFPWETDKQSDELETVTRVLQHLGEDPTREGLVRTPARVSKMWKEIYGGYSKDPKEVLGTLFESPEDEMVLCTDIEFYSTCEHHMVPFYGKVHIGYIPGGQVVGLSKLARLVDIFARRLQLQERLTSQIASAIMEHVPGCKGAGVVVEGIHLCMRARGVAKQNSVMKTSSLLGMFRTPETRAEFLSLIK